MNYQFLTQKYCTICEGSNTEVLYENIKDNLCIDNEFVVLKCHDCNHAFTSPIPNEEYYKDDYTDQYYSYNVDIEKNNKRFRYRLKRKIYLDHTFFTKFLTKLIIRQTAIFPTPVTNGKILDVGCGNGSFLTFMKDLGWDTYGVEISEKAVEIATRNGNKVFLGNLKDAKYPDNYFDSITLNNVLEHLTNPFSDLKEIYRILKPSGEIIICVPNFSSYGSKLYKKEWLGLMIPQHLNHFTPKSLHKIVNKMGFKKPIVKGIYRPMFSKNLLVSLRSKEVNNKFILLLKALVLKLFFVLTFPMIFFEAGINFCPFITIKSHK